MSAALPIDALAGRSVGGLAGVKLRFRPQLFWQEVLPEHAATSDLDFHCDMATGRNYARIPGGSDVPSDGSYARSVARAVADDASAPHETALATRALREAATFSGDPTPLRHLLSSCYCSRGSLQLALVEASRADNLQGVNLLLDAGAVPSVSPEGKTACAPPPQMDAAPPLKSTPQTTTHTEGLPGRPWGHVIPQGLWGHQGPQF